MAIRELSAPAIQAAADSGQIIGITNGRSLAAVLYPISQVLTEQLIVENLARITHNISRGEREVGAADEVADQVAGKVADGGGAPLPTLDGLLSAPAEVPALDLGRARQVNLRDLSGKVLSEAARRNQPIALTTNRVLAGVVVAIPEQWVNQLVSLNLSRLVRGIQVGERELSAGGPLTTLDDEVTTSPPRGD